MTFTLSPEELKTFGEWVAKHASVYTGAIGGRYSFNFTPTSIGIIVKVTDNVTGDIKDLTNYRDW